MFEDVSKEELARLRAEHRRVSDLLTLIQELTSRAVRSESVGDLFSRAFPTLFRCVPFDLGVAVMLEQHLDLYISTRRGAEPLVNEELIAKIRTTLENQIPVSFATTEVLVKAEHADLAVADGPGIGHEAFAVLEQERRTSGMLLLFRDAEPFTSDERQILTIFSTQVAMLLASIEARENIANLADTDDLTGFWNKRYFRRQLPHEIERARAFGIPLTLLMVDIDDFKQINDSFGHVLGDVVLSELCGVIRETLRNTDVLTRFGGDEFAIILPHTDLASAVAVSQRLLTRISALTIPTDEESAIRCSVSIGIAEYGRDDQTADDLVRRADGRLYESKRGGKNRYTA